MKKFDCSAIGKCCRGFVVMCAIMTSKGVALARITVNHRVRLPRERRLNLRLSGPGNKFIFLSQMHQKWRAKPIDLSQVFFGIAAVISDGGVHARIAHSCQETISAPRQ